MEDQLNIKDYILEVQIENFFLEFIKSLFCFNM